MVAEESDRHCYAKFFGLFESIVLNQNNFSRHLCTTHHKHVKSNIYGKWSANISYWVPIIFLCPFTAVTQLVFPGRRFVGFSA